MKKGQTSNEYIIIFAIVLVMAIIITTILGGFSSFTGPAGEKSLKTAWLVNNPIGISYWTSTPNGTYIHFRNNVEGIIQLNTVTLSGRQYNVSKVITHNNELKFYTDDYNASGSYSYSMIINYSYVGSSGEYLINDEDLVLSGTGSHAFINTGEYFEGIYIPSSQLASVTNLQSPSKTNGSIYWTWINPGGSFTHAVVYLDGVWAVNTSNAYYNATGLSDNTAYTITVHTANGTYVNDTDINSTITTDETILPLVWNLFETYSYGTEQELTTYNRTEEISFGGRLDTPVLYMDFNSPNEGTYVQDNSIYNNFGTLTGATYNENGGAFGGGYIFDAVTDEITIPASSILNDWSNNQITVSAWINLSSYTPTYSVIVAQRTTTVSNWQFYADVSDALYFNFWDTGATNRACSTNVQVQTGVWTHVVATYDGNYIKIYVNGTNRYNCQFTQQMVSGSALTIIGDESYDNGFAGMIDEVQIWKRSLTALEVSQLYSTSGASIGKYANEGEIKSKVNYNETSTYWNTTFSLADNNGSATTYDLCNNDANCISYWPLDDSQGTNVYADAKGINNGTPTGTNNATGLSSGAMRFDGSSKIAVGTLNITTFSEMSMGMWQISYDETSGFLISIEHSGNDDIRIYKFAGTAGTCSFDDGTAQNALFSDSFYDGKWHHIFCTFNGSEIKTYLDGKLEDTRPHTFNFSSASGISEIGDRVPSSGPFEGYLDEIVIYNKTINLSQIQELYKAGLSQHANTNITLQTRTASSYNLSDEGLVGFWSFNEDNATTVFDELGRNNGTWTNGAIPLDESGVVGMGGYFDGDNDYIDLGKPNELTFNRTSDFSISIWFNPKTIGTEPLIAKRWHTGVDETGWSINYWNFADKVISVDLVNHSGNLNMIRKRFAAGDLTNQWNQLVVTYDGSSNATGLKAYLNNVELELIISSPSTNALIDNLTGNFDYDTSVKIGTINGYNNFFNGSIDEVRIYNRSLSAAEIQNLYELGSSHIEWNDWQDEGKMEDGIAKQSTNTGKFMQFKTIFQTNNTDVSPYLFTHRIDVGN